MKLSDQKIWILLVKVLALTALGVVIYLLAHELSHLLIMIICNGVFEDMQIGTTSFVSGFIDSKFVSITAMSSLVIPLIFSTVMFLFKNQYVNIFTMGFTVPSLTHSILGLFAILFIKDSTRHTYDAALAYDFAKLPIIITLLTVFGIIYSAFLLIMSFVKLMKNI